MKMLLTALAAVVMAGAAAAQTVTPTDPAAPVPMDSMQAAPPADAAAAPGATTLVEKDGKWWNGEREATKDEIAAYKKAMKAGTPG